MTSLCYNTRMDLSNTTEVILALRDRLEPVERANAWKDPLEGYHLTARRASVLLALFDQDYETSLIFIRRASTLRSHSGEIAFPGGSFEPTDDTRIITALREAQEEIGLEPSRAEVLGVMPPVFTVVSNFLITPVVAHLPGGPGTLQLQASEVAEVIFLPLKELADPAIYHSEQWMRDGVPHTVYFYDYGSYRIWGATARMLNALLELLQSGT
jgi:8-oxo-dGTP pyrophosphatase MutT (NUDIX family)